MVRFGIVAPPIPDPPTSADAAAARRSLSSLGLGATHGRTYRVVAWLDKHQGAFAISRLIMMTGLKLRSFTDASPDDPAVLVKLETALRSMLSPSDWVALVTAVESGP